MKTLAVLLISSAGLSAADAPSVTFYRDVLPILQERCQGCHRAGEIGPMPLGSYTEVRPWAKAIRQAVISRKMPPWNAEGPRGKFRNDPSLSQAEIDKLTGWIDGGAPEGSVKDAPRGRGVSSRAGASARPTWFSRCLRRTMSPRRARSSTATSSCLPALRRTAG